MATVRLIIRGQTLEDPYSGFRVTLDARDFNHDDREGTLPPLPPSLVEALEAWRSAYGAQEEVRSHCRMTPGAITRRSIRDINQLAEALEHHFNTWLRSTDRGWVRIRELLVRLASHDPRLLLDCGNHPDLKRLPWQEWELFTDHYRRGDVALRMVNDSRQPLPDYPLPRSARVRILVVVGDCTGINATQDLACITRLQSNNPKRVEVLPLWQPTPADLQRALEQSAGFHIVIYIGHSRSREDGQVGWLLLNSQDELSIRDFHRAMGQAIQRGLQLVILNSCDGLGLAQQLANLDLPYCVVMKEPVPDDVAVEFIDRFFRAFLEEHQSLQGAVRQARHGLESFNSRYSEVTWLPTVCMRQNAPPLTWQALLNDSKAQTPSPATPITYLLPIFLLGVVGILGGGGYYWYTSYKGQAVDRHTPAANSLPNPAASPLNLPTNLPVGSQVRVDGSTSMVTFNNRMGEAFKAKYPGVQYSLRATGSSRGIQALLAGEVEVAASSRPLKPEEVDQGLVAVPIKTDAIAILVGKSNPFNGELTTHQLRAVYSGQVTNWSQLGGPNLPLRVINRNFVSGTYELFQSNVLGGASFGGGANWVTMPKDVTTELLQKLGTNGIGYANYSQIKTQRTIRAVPIDGQLPGDAAYPLVSVLYYVYGPQASDAAKAFVALASGPVGQEIAASE
jgi:ABC-type phosphate transport system substrate-binding protein